MTTGATPFPKPQLLWPGAIMASIAHAIFICRAPFLSHENSWDGSNYNVQDSAGSRGTIAFSGDKFVGVFFFDESVRNPFRSRSVYTLEQFLTGLPSHLQSLAYDEALQYVLQEFNGEIVPIITAAFWGDGTSSKVTAAESWDQVFEHGAFLVRNELLPPEVALKQWESDCNLRQEEVNLARSLFQRKTAEPQRLIKMNHFEHQLWKKISADETGIEESRESFKEIGILLNDA